MVDPSTPYGSEILRIELDYFEGLCTKDHKNPVWMRQIILFLKSRFPFLPGYDSSLINYFKVNESLLPLFEEGVLTIKEIAQIVKAKYPNDVSKGNTLFLEISSRQKTLSDRQKHLKERYGNERLNARGKLYYNYIKNYTPHESPDSIKLWEVLQCYKFEDNINNAVAELSSYFEPGKEISIGSFSLKSNSWFSRYGNILNSTFISKFLSNTLYMIFFSSSPSAQIFSQNVQVIYDNPIDEVNTRPPILGCIAKKLEPWNPNKEFTIELEKGIQFKINRETNPDLFNYLNRRFVMMIYSLHCKASYLMLSKVRPSELKVKAFRNEYDFFNNFVKLFIYYSPLSYSFVCQTIDSSEFSPDSKILFKYAFSQFIAYRGGNPDLFLLKSKEKKLPSKKTAGISTITPQMLESTPLELIDFNLEFDQKCLLGIYLCGWALRKKDLSDEKLKKILFFIFDIQYILVSRSEAGIEQKPNLGGLLRFYAYRLLYFKLEEPFFSILRSISDEFINREFITIPIERRKYLLSLQGISPEFATTLALRPEFLHFQQTKYKCSPDKGKKCIGFCSSTFARLLDTNELTLFDLVYLKLPEDFSEDPQVVDGAKYALFEGDSLLSESIKFFVYENLLGEVARNHLAMLYLYRISNPNAKIDVKLDIPTYKGINPYEEKVEEFSKDRSKARILKNVLPIKRGKELLKQEKAEKEAEELRKKEEKLKRQEQQKRIQEENMKKIRTKQEAKRLAEEKANRLEEERKKKAGEKRVLKVVNSKRKPKKGKGKSYFKKESLQPTLVDSDVENIPPEEQQVRAEESPNEIEITREEFEKLSQLINRENYDSLKEEVVEHIKEADVIVVDTEMTGIRIENWMKIKFPERFPALDKSMQKSLTAEGRNITLSSIEISQFHQVTQLGILCLKKVGGNNWTLTKIFTIEAKALGQDLTKDDFHPETYKFFEMDEEKLAKYNKDAAPKEAYELFARSILEKRNADGSKFPLILFNGLIDLIQLSKLAGRNYYMPHEFFESQLGNMEIIDVKLMCECLMAFGKTTLMWSNMENMMALFRIKSFGLEHSAGYDAFVTWLLYQKVKTAFNKEPKIDYKPYQGFICRLGPEQVQFLKRQFDLVMPSYQ